MVPYAKDAMDQGRTRDSGATAILIGCAAIPAVAIVVAGAAGVVLFRRSQARSIASNAGPGDVRSAAPSHASAPPRAPKHPPSDSTAAASRGTSGAADAGVDAAPATPAVDDIYAIRVSDPGHVDPVDLLAQARRIARAYDPHAALVSIYALQGFTAGTVDITSMNAVTYDFEWRYQDKSQPPGQDDVQGGLWITVRNGRFTVMDLHHASMYAVEKNHRPDPGPDPRCSARNAWKAAVRSGIPQNAVARMRYEASFPGWAGRPYVWVFRVQGHQELRREIDGMTCMLRP